jgi:hypothetical protein
MATGTIKKSQDELTMLQVASNWHLKIAAELESPILPESIPDTVRKAKLEEIDRQREKHKAYSEALNALVRVRKHQLERMG